MKIKCLIVCLAALLAGIGKAHAQGVCKRVVNNFNSPVLSHVYDFAARMNLSEAKQLALAGIFAREDSLVKLSIINNKPPEVIRAIRANAMQEALSVLSPSEKNLYYVFYANDNLMKEINAVATAETIMAEGDSAFKASLRDTYYQRGIAFRRLADSIADYGVLAPMLLHEALQYQVALNRYKNEFAENKYFAKRLSALEKIKPLEASEKEKLKGHFHRLCFKNRHESQAELFNEAMQLVLFDTAYYGVQYRNQIDFYATKNAGKYAAETGEKNQLSREGYHQVYPIILEREKKLALLNFAYPANPRRKEILYDGIVAKYDSLLRLALLYQGAGQPRNAFSLALRHRKALELRPGQADSLVAESQAIIRLREAYAAANPDDEYNSKAQECVALKKILNEKQVTKVLTIKNTGMATRKAMQDWREIRTRNLAQASDSLTYTAQLTRFYLAKQNAVDRHHDDIPRQEINIKAIVENKPPILKKLSYQKKHNYPVEGKVSNSLQW